MVYIMESTLTIFRSLRLSGTAHGAFRVAGHLDRPPVHAAGIEQQQFAGQRLPLAQPDMEAIFAEPDVARRAQLALDGHDSAGPAPEADGPEAD